MSRLYLLDTDICAFILRRSPERLLERVQSVPLDQQCISMMTLAELLFGVEKSNRKKANRAAVEALVQHLAVLDWSRAAAECYAGIRVDLERRGQMIGASDLMIAAHALSVGATLVTNNVRDFRRVKSLVVENWTE